MVKISLIVFSCVHRNLFESPKGGLSFRYGMSSNLINSAKIKITEPSIKRQALRLRELDLDTNFDSSAYLFCYHGQVINPLEGS